MNRNDNYNTIDKEKKNDEFMWHYNRFDQNDIKSNSLLGYSYNTLSNNSNYQRGYSEYCSQRNNNSNSNNDNCLFRGDNNKQSNLNDLVLSPGDNNRSINDRNSYSLNPYLQSRLNGLENSFNASREINNRNGNQLPWINSIIRSSELSFPYLPQYTDNNKKTLILDLDETLVHSTFASCPMYSDFKVNVRVNNQCYPVSVLKRPYIDEFLKTMAKHYELVVFTASISQYANSVIDKIDPNHLIHHRLFREHCICYNNLYVKDLKFLGRYLNETIIIDNNPISYVLNKDNGIPILTWHNDQKDTELLKMIPFLVYLAYVSNVREVIKRVKKGNTIDYTIINSLVNKKNNRNSFKPSIFESNCRHIRSDNDNMLISNEKSSNDINQFHVDKSLDKLNEGLRQKEKYYDKNYDSNNENRIEDCNKINYYYYKNKENTERNIFRKKNEKYQYPNHINHYPSKNNDLVFDRDNFNNNTNRDGNVNNNYNQYQYNNCFSQYKKPAIDYYQQHNKLNLDYSQTLNRPNSLKIKSNPYSNNQLNNNKYPLLTEASPLSLFDSNANAQRLSKSLKVGLPLLQSKRNINRNYLYNTTVTDYNNHLPCYNNIRESYSELYLDKQKQIKTRELLQ